MSNLSAAPVRLRHEWIDAAKGFCMILVVMLHTAERLEFELGLGEHAFWSQVSLFFNPVRMPLFFFISGFLASSAMSRTLGQTRSRTLGMAFIYVVWTIVIVGRLFIPMARGGNSLPTVHEFILAVLLPTNYWYLYALPLYFLMTWGLTRALGKHRIYAVVPLGLLSIASFLPAFRPKLDEPLDALMVGAVCANAVWFYVGVTGKETFLRMMSRASPAKLIATLAVYVALLAGSGVLGITSELKFLLSISVLAVSAQLFGLLRFEGRMAGIAKWTGRQTLPVYLFHILFLAAFGAVYRISGLDSLTERNPELWAIVLVPVGTAGLVAVSVFLGSALKNSKANWLIEAPWWVVGHAGKRQTLAPRELSGRA